MLRLNSDEDDTVSDVLCFYHDFTKHDKEKKLRQRGGCSTFIWSTYHDDQNPPLRKIQDSFSRIILNSAEKPFNQIVSVHGDKVPVDAMMIANHRAKNLGDLFFIRNIEEKPGPQVSSYL